MNGLHAAAFASAVLMMPFAVCAQQPPPDLGVTGNVSLVSD